MNNATGNGRQPRRQPLSRQTNGIAECRCPLCQSILPPNKFASIIGAQQAREAEIEQTITPRFSRQIAEADRKKKAEIDAAVKAATEALRNDQAGVVAAAVETEREKAGKAVTEAVAAAKLEHATEKLKLEQQLGDLQRKLAAKPAHIIGLPAEIDLHKQISAMLSTVAPEDRVSRVPPGKEGADVVIEVVERGEVCGKVIVESKNHKVWKSSFTTRLRQVQLRQGAAFAVLASPIFWSGAPAHIALRDGVICAKPEAVPTLIALLRQIVVDNHVSALGMQARDEKAEKALQFMCGPTCNDLMTQLLKLTGDLAALDQREQSAHTTTWNRRAEIVQGVIAVREQFVRSVATIIAGDAP